MDHLIQIVSNNNTTSSGGIYSVCSASVLVLEAAMQQACKDQTPLLIEATSNQVNQFGGYTGMVPEQFRDFAFELADRAGLARDLVILGGDHLGPNCWQKEPAEQAMDKSRTLIKAYVKAGFKKIHLDTSMSCAGDPVPLSDETVAKRAAELCLVAEQQAQESFGSSDLVYVVGTEVPVPGGAQEELDTLSVTTPDRARATIACHYDSFHALDLDEAWNRVIGLVVQPGVEFDHTAVVDFVPEAARELSQFIEDYPGMVFEAHSTDYQPPHTYRSLVKGHFAILKVGPQLTWAMREALMALAHIEVELVAAETQSRLRDVIEQVMLAEPGYWQAYYTDSADQLHISRRYSYSDRIRYYWGHPRVRRAVDTLIENLTAIDIPLPLISQYLPEQYHAIRNHQLTAEPKAMIHHKIMQVTEVYAQACGSDQ